MIGAAVLAEARAMVGVPWRHMGRSAAGVDCIGLVLLAASRAGVALPEPAPYAREPQDHALRAALGEHLEWVPLDQVQDGDVVLFSMGIYAGHVGIAGLHPIYGVPSVIHAHLPRRCVIEEPREAFARHLTGAYRWRA